MLMRVCSRHSGSYDQNRIVDAGSHDDDSCGATLKGREVSKNILEKNRSQEDKFFMEILGQLAARKLYPNDEMDQ